jgi:type I restriction enzyme M protein
MLRTELRTNIDKKWEACWPINTLRPLVLLDLISYLLFIKKLGEKQLIAGMHPQPFRGNLNYTKEKTELSWSRFKDLDAQSMHELFTKEKGIPELMKNYGDANLVYSPFVKEPLLLAPTARLLANMIDIIKIMEAEDVNIRASIFEYLLNKGEMVGQNGQVYAPDYVVKLIVALMQPAPEDLIGDPSAGNGSFLVNSAMYIARKNAASGSNLKNDAGANIYKGIECDPIQLRIGAMNMILHGIEYPQLECLNVFGKANFSLREQPTLILSNLFFKDPENRMTVGENTLPMETKRPEIPFLTLILKNLKSGGRVAIIIREIILYSNITEIKTIRRQVIDDHKLEAVISLPAKAGSPFSGACILIFTKPESVATDKVWFYKMEGPDNGINKKESDLTLPGRIDEPYFAGLNNDVPDILNRWDLRDRKFVEEETEKSFYVSVNDIKNNNYNLSFSQYKEMMKERERSQLKPPAENKKKAVRKAPFKRRLSIIGISLLFIFTAVLGSYFLYFKNTNNDLFFFLTRHNVSPDSANGIVDDTALTVKRPVLKEQYAVITRAYFHSLPNEGSRRRVYLNHGNHLVLNPIDEKNGFIYILYTNRRGQITKGWLNKKDLKPLR